MAGISREEIAYDFDDLVVELYRERVFGSFVMFVNSDQIADEIISLFVNEFILILVIPFGLQDYAFDTLNELLLRGLSLGAFDVIDILLNQIHIYGVENMILVVVL